MATIASYADWVESAKDFDRMSGKQKWRADDQSDQFDHRMVRAKLQTLAALRQAGDGRALLYVLNEGIHGNIEGIANESLWRQARFGTKQLIHDYVDEMVSALLFIASDETDTITDDEKRDFFRRASLCYGRSALLLSGSGAYISFHAGVVKALHAEGVLPHIISGSSGGSVIGAIACTHSDEELKDLLRAEDFADDKPDKKGSGLASWFGAGTMMREDEVIALLAKLIPDLTFRESFELTGRHFNVSVSPAERHQRARLLNAITSPDVFVREAVRASCAVPGFFEPAALMAKDEHGRRVPYLAGRRWVDGAIAQDLPQKSLARLYGVNHHIVSQANPLLGPLTSDMKRPTSSLSTIRHAAVATMKAWVNAQMRIFERPLSLFPPLSTFANLSISLMNQEKSGDITIVRPAFLLSPAKILSNLSIADVGKLIELGEKMTWPKIEMIRTQSLIGVTLSEILSDFEQLTGQSIAPNSDQLPSHRPAAAAF